MAEVKTPSDRTRDQLLKELETASKQLQSEKAAKKREAKARGEMIKDIEAQIDDILEQLENAVE